MTTLDAVDQNRLVSVIIVTYQSAQYISFCLDSVSRSEDVSHEIIVIDNASTDGTAELITRDWTDVTLVKNSNNVGFGAACNQVIPTVS